MFPIRCVNYVTRKMNRCTIFLLTKNLQKVSVIGYSNGVGLKINNSLMSAISSILQHHGKLSEEKSNFSTIIFFLMWNIWLARNDRIFKELRLSHTKVTYNVITLSSQWCKHRRNIGCSNWTYQCCSPFFHLNNFV